MKDGLDEIAKSINDAEARRSELAKRLRFNSGKIEYQETLEQQLCYPVEKREINGKFASVDSGIGGEELHGFDFLISRTVGVLFEYSSSRITAHKYFPAALPLPEYDIRSGLDSHEVMWHKSLYRLKSELSCASGMIETLSPDYMLMDGSIAPLLSDKPSEDSEMKQLYDDVLHEYRRLYSSAWKSNTALLGVIKDSRSKRFIEIVQKHAQNEPGFEHTSDTGFLYFLLEQSERTCAFSYSSSPSKHQILKDLGEWSGKILSFYLKPVADDRPLRVEFLSGQKTFDEIASVVHSLSCLHKAYAYPAILIEADLRAALSPDEFERAYGSLFTKLGRSSSMMRLRRNTRPFR